MEMHAKWSVLANTLPDKLLGNIQYPVSTESDITEKVGLLLSVSLFRRDMSVLLSISSLWSTPVPEHIFWMSSAPYANVLG